MVRAFVKDLGNVFETAGPQETPTRIITFSFAAGTTQKWTAERDVVLVGVACSGAMVLSTNASYTSYNTVYAATKVYVDVLFMSNVVLGQMNPVFGKLSVPILGGSSIYCLSNGSGHLHMAVEG